MACAGCGGRRSEIRQPNNSQGNVATTTITINKTPSGGLNGGMSSINNSGSNPFGNLKYGPKKI